jgi:ribulose-5-phosphate 4-epimerase/fuculose-1-phosphate aldolase
MPVLVHGQAAVIPGPTPSVIWNRDMTRNRDGVVGATALTWFVFLRERGRPGPNVGRKTMDTVQDGTQVSAETRSELEDLVKGSRILELNGHSDRIWGHVAMRDPEGRGFWLKRHGISLGEVFDADDFQLTSFEGELLHGKGRRHSEWPIHGEIFLRRPDILFTAHTHPFYSSIFSAVPEPLRQVRGGTTIDVARYEGSSELVTTRERGAELAEALGDSGAVFMRNHGVVFTGASVLDMIKLGIELETACHQTLTANGSGYAWRWPDDAEMARKSGDVASKKRGGALWDYYCRVLARAEAAGDPRLSQAPVTTS